MKKWLRLLPGTLLGITLLLLAVGYYFYVPEIPAEVLEAKYGVKSHHYIEVDGMKVHYRVEGPAADTVPLVLLHGTLSSLYTWSGWTESLKDRHRVIRLDLPGFGFTGPHPEEDYRVEAYLEFMQAFLSELGVKQCVLVGNSLGGEIAWRYALNHPRQVTRLILIGAAGYPVELEELPLSQLPLSFIWLHVPLLRELSVRFASPGVIRNSLEYLYGDPEKVTDELVELYFDLTHREGNREVLTERMGVMGRSAPYEDISSITVPALVMWGGRDRLIPVEHAEKFHRDLACSKLSIFPEAGHMPMEEIPGKSIGLVEEFISGNSDLDCFGQEEKIAVVG